MGEIENKILKILKSKKKVSREELIRDLREHPGVVLEILKNMQKRKVIKVERVKKSHNPKKFEIYYYV